MPHLVATNTSTAVPVGAAYDADDGQDVVQWVNETAISVGILQTPTTATDGVGDTITVTTGNQSGGGAGGSGLLTISSGNTLAGATGSTDTLFSTGSTSGSTPGPSGDFIFATGTATGTEGQVLYQDTLTPAYSGPFLSQGFSLVTPETIAAVAAEVAFTTQVWVVPANLLRAGTTVRFRVLVTQIDATSTVNHTVRVRYGDSATVAGDALLAETETVNLNQDEVGIIEGTMIVRSTGATGAQACVATTTMGAINTVEAVEVFRSPTTDTIDTVTANEELYVTIQFSANTDSQVRLDQFHVTVGV